MSVPAENPHGLRLVRFSRVVLEGHAAPKMRSQTILSRHLLGYSAFYMLDGEVLLESPEADEGLEKELKGHVGLAAWEEWNRSKSKAASNIQETASAWQRTASLLAPLAKDAGLITIQKFSSEEVDAFWSALFVRSIWTEQVDPADRSVLFWKDAHVAEESLVVPVRHTLDAVNVWVFQGSNMVRSQTREPVEKMKAAWKAVYDETMPEATRLSAQRDELLASSRVLQQGLKNLQDEVRRSGRLPGTCELCKETSGAPAQGQRQ